MKLTAQDTANLSSILSTCLLGGIESIVIEDGYVRGLSENKTFAIISNFNIPKFPCRIGLARIASLKQRLELFVNNAATVIEAKESERGDISTLDISAGRSKVQFRCTSPMLIKAPKTINDEEAFKIFASREELKMVLNAVKVMGGKDVQLVIKKDRSVSFSLSDASNDVFNSSLETPCELLGEEQDSVVHYYHSDIFLAVMRAGIEANDSVVFTVGEVGTIRSEVNGHSVVMFSKIDVDSQDEEE